jgi:hypothetical protein
MVMALDPTRPAMTDGGEAHRPLSFRVAVPGLALAGGERQAASAVVLPRAWPRSPKDVRPIDVGIEVGVVAFGVFDGE